MNYSNIKRVLSAALLLAFVAPTATAVSSNNYSASATSLNTSSMVLSGDVRLTNKNDLITLSLRDSDVKQVLRMFADKAGMNIVFHPSVDGKVTLDLVKTPINDAFNLVLQITGLNYYKQGNAMIIIAKDHADNATFSKQEMYTFPVKYVSATKVADFLNKNVFGMRRAGLSGIDAATVNSSTNELIIFGMPGDVPIVEKVIAQFDKEPISKTFAVNHTTPQQMADMICKVLLPSRGIVTSSDGGGSGSQGFVPMMHDDGTAGAMTGGAASASSSGGDATELKLGEGIVACSVSSSSNSSTASPFDVQNLSVAFFPQRGTITVMGGSDAQINMIEKFIKDNDMKQQQALLEVSIVELNEAGSKAFQNDWAISSKAWGFHFNGTNTSGGREGGPFGTWIDAVDYETVPGMWNEDHTSYTPPQFIETPIKILSPARTYVQWTMNYLIENRKARVLANPKIMITNGQESVIDMTQDYVESVDAEVQSASNAGNLSTSIVGKTYNIEEDLGISVTLVPFISPEGYVTLNIKPNYSTIQQQIIDPQLGMVGATLLSRRNLDLKNIRIKDGETLVLGGMIQESEQKTVTKIPVLGDLPIIGPVFRSTSTNKEKSELVIMITPHILNDGDGTTANNL